MEYEKCGFKGCDKYPEDGRVYCDECDMLVDYEGSAEDDREFMREANEE